MWCVIAHYHELALKGRNRSFFIRQLAHNLKRSTADFDVVGADALPGRIRLRFAEETNVSELWAKLKERISTVLGIANFSLAFSVPLNGNGNLATLNHAIEEAIHPYAFNTFRVTTKRADKRFPKTSMDVSREVGAYVSRLGNYRVNLTNPEFTIYIELLRASAFVSFLKIPGPGGLPVGMSGTVVCLLSGGIDSPVAAYRMMKRGCRILFAHFHSHPYVSRASREKAEELVAHLTRHQNTSSLYCVPFGEIQKQVVLAVPPAYRIVIYRRLMVRIAEAIARQHRAWALVTGDSLGQVASQVPDNLTVIEAASELPILRPLIGMDKDEITAQAQSIGTYETSVIPDQDCCRLFTPAHPVIRTTVDEVRKVESRLDMPELVQQGVKGAELSEFSFP